MDREKLKKHLNKKAKGAALDEALDLLYAAVARLDAVRAAGDVVVKAGMESRGLLQMVVDGNTVVPSRSAPSSIVDMDMACEAFRKS